MTYYCQLLTLFQKTVIVINTQFDLCKSHQAQLPTELEQVNHWLVLDGPLEPDVVIALEMLAKGEGLTLPNGDTLLLPRMYAIILYL